MPTIFKPTYLYVKTHKITGLRYFGKTCKADPHKYKGSGTRWINHIRAHGYLIDTEIIGYYTIKEECEFAALTFSKENDIVNSAQWANLHPENGIDGGLRTNSGKNFIVYNSNPRPQQHREKIRNILSGRNQSEESNLKRRKTQSKQYKGISKSKTICRISDRLEMSPQGFSCWLRSLP